jgi:hypothetical protein
MKKKIILSGGLKEMVTYCTAIYKVDKDVDTEYLTNIVSKSPVFENKSFYTNVLGTVQRTTITRNTNLFVKENKITLQIRYDILNVVDIKLTEKDEEWIKNDVESLLKHFELLVTPFDEEKDE